MIYTCTLNPAIDYYLKLPEGIVAGEINRAGEAIYQASGKGINVTLILQELGIASTAIFFAGGFSGDYIMNSLKSFPLVSQEVIKINEANRINVKLLGKEETALNAEGPYIDRKAQQELLAKLEVLQKDDWLIVAGNLPRGIETSFIVEMANICHEKAAKLVVDTNCLSKHDYQEIKPFLIKPNLEEFANIFGNEHSDHEEASRELLNIGISQILLSKGKHGASLYTDTDTYYVQQAEVVEVSSVGAGDAMLAGYISGIIQKKSIKESLILAAAAGAATVSKVGLASFAEIEKYRKGIVVRKQ